MAFQHLTTSVRNVTKEPLMETKTPLFEILERESAHFLMLRYPGLANYIQESFNRGNDNELIDFIFAIDTEDMVYFN